MTNGYPVPRVAWVDELGDFDPEHPRLADLGDPVDLTPYVVSMNAEEPKTSCGHTDGPCRICDNMYPEPDDDPEKD